MSNTEYISSWALVLVLIVGLIQFSLWLKERNTYNIDKMNQIISSPKIVIYLRNVLCINHHKMRYPIGDEFIYFIFENERITISKSTTSNFLEILTYLSENGYINNQTSF